MVSQQPLQRHCVPSVSLAVHEDLGTLLDDPRNPDSDAEDRRRVDSPIREHRSQAGGDVPDDLIHLMLGGVEWVLRFRPLGHRQVEQIDPYPSLADVDADDVAVVGVDVEQHARPASVGALPPDLGDNALVEQLADDLGDRSHAQPSRGTEILAAVWTAEIQRPENDHPVLAPKVQHRAAPSMLHRPL